MLLRNSQTLRKIILTLTLAFMTGFICLKFKLSTSILIIISSYSLFITYKWLADRKKVSQLFISLESLQNNILGTTAQLQESCHQLEASSDEQSSAIIETSSTGDEIGAMVQKTSQSLGLVSKSAAQINNLIQSSQKSSNELSINIKNSSEQNLEIIKSLDDVSSKIEGLLELFNDVTNKTNVINDIVFQTKLLSFNAAVEAARAGEVGKGFAVVAEEIGNLAKSSGESANAINQTLEVTSNSINEIIQDIKKKNEILSSQLQKSTRENIQQLEKFNNSFVDVVSSTTDITSQVQDITEASIEQSRGVEELGLAIHTISTSVQSNTLVVAQTLNLGKMLANNMQQFKSIFTQTKKEFSYDKKVNLELLKWNDKYLIGINEMDDEHKTLVNKINLLITQLNHGRHESILQSFEALADYTLHHFREEEKFLKEINYHSLDSHKRVHENLLDNIRRFKFDLEKRDLDKIKLVSFLKNWLFTHIAGVDTKYAEHYNSVNLKGEADKKNAA